MRQYTVIYVNTTRWGSIVCDTIVIPKQDQTFDQALADQNICMSSVVRVFAGVLQPIVDDWRKL